MRETQFSLTETTLTNYEETLAGLEILPIEEVERFLIGRMYEGVANDLVDVQFQVRRFGDDNPVIPVFTLHQLELLGIPTESYLQWDHRYGYRIDLPQREIVEPPDPTALYHYGIWLQLMKLYSTFSFERNETHDIHMMYLEENFDEMIEQLKEKIRSDGTPTDLDLQEEISLLYLYTRAYRHTQGSAVRDRFGS